MIDALLFYCCHVVRYDVFRSGGQVSACLALREDCHSSRAARGREGVGTVVRALQKSGTFTIS